MKTFLIYTLAVLLGIMSLGVIAIMAYWAYLIHWSVGLFFGCLEIIGLCVIGMEALDGK